MRSSGTFIETVGSKIQKEQEVFYVVFLDFEKGVWLSVKGWAIEGVKGLGMKITWWIA